MKKKPASKTKSKVTRTSGKPGRRAGPGVAGRKAASPSRGLRTRAGSPLLAQSARDRREALAAAGAAIEAALDKKAVLPVLIDVSGQASYTDFIAIVSGRSDRQVAAIAENVSRAMQERGRRLLGREGTRNGRWALLDFGDVVVHVFYHPVREVFDIESLWIDAPRIKLQVPSEALLDGPPPLQGP